MSMKRVIVSAGGVISRYIRGQALGLFVSTKDGLLTFPKGHLQKNETIEQTAIREVKEEIGIKDVKLIKKLGVILREGVEPNGEKSQKEIHLFAMQGSGMTFDHEENFVWVGLTRARPFLQFEEEKDFLLEHQEVIAMSPSNDLNVYDLEDKWDELHRKNMDRDEDDVLRENDVAHQTLQFLNDQDSILEIGVSTGRDALLFAKQKNTKIVGCDISQVALREVQKKFFAQGLEKSFTPLHGAAENFFSADIPRNINLFYSRFSLNLSINKTFFFLNDVIKKMEVGGRLVLEGKTKKDYKVQRAHSCGLNLVMDDQGFLILVWDERFIMQKLIQPLRLKSIEISHRPYEWKGEKGESLLWIAQKVEDYSY